MLFRLVLFIFIFFTSTNSYAENITLRMANWLPPTHPWVANIMIPWIEKVKIATEGRITINLLKAPLGPPPAHFDFAAKGIADITYGVHNYTSGRFITTQITELPFLSNSSEILSVAWQRIYERELLELNEHRDTHLLGVYTHGPGQLWLSQKYDSINNVKGLKIRIGGGIAQSSAKALGLVPLQAPVTKAYELLSGGVADGITLPAESIHFFKLDRIIKQGFEFEGGLYNTSMFLVINKKKWDSLSKKDQEAINSVSGEELAKLAGKAWDEADKTGISMSKKNEIEIIKLSKNEKEITRKLLLPIINETLNKIKIKKNIDALKIYSMLIREIEILENR